MVVTLADAVTRSSLFDQVALKAIVGSGYDTSSLALAGPFAATFDDVELAPDLSAAPIADGSWMSIDGSSRYDARFSLVNVADAGAPSPAAIWSGSISAQAVIGSATVATVAQSWNGSGAPTYADSAVVTYAPAQPAAAIAAVSFPVLAVVFAVDTNPSMIDLLRESSVSRTRLALARPPAPRPALPVTSLATVIWVVNETVFDDTDWPGASAGMSAADARTARRDRAGTWLAAQHIALALAA